MTEKNLLPEPRMMTSFKGSIYTEEKVFYGAGINKVHYTNDGIKTICGVSCYSIDWKRDKDGMHTVDCIKCMKVLSK